MLKFKLISILFIFTISGFLLPGNFSLDDPPSISHEPAMVSSKLDLEIFLRLHAALKIADIHDIENKFQAHYEEYREKLYRIFSLYFRINTQKINNYFMNQHQNMPDEINPEMPLPHTVADDDLDSDLCNFEKYCKELEGETVDFFSRRYDEAKEMLLATIKSDIACVFSGHGTTLEKYQDLFDTLYRQAMIGWKIVEIAGFNMLIDGVINNEMTFPCDIMMAPGICGWYSTIGMALQLGIPDVETVLHLYPIQEYPFSIGNPEIFQTVQLKKLSRWLRNSPHDDSSNNGSLIEHVKNLIPGRGLGVDAQGYSHPGALVHDISIYSGANHQGFDTFDECRTMIIERIEQAQPVFVLIFRQQGMGDSYNDTPHYVNIIGHISSLDEFIVMDLSVSRISLWSADKLEAFMSKELDGQLHWLADLKSYSSKAKRASDVVEKFSSCTCDEYQACFNCAISEIANLDMHYQEIDYFNIFITDQ